MEQSERQDASAWWVADLLRSAVLASQPDHLCGLGEHAGDGWLLSRERAVWRNSLVALNQGGVTYTAMREVLEALRDRPGEAMPPVFHHAKDLAERWSQATAWLRRLRANGQPGTAPAPDRFTDFEG